MKKPARIGLLCLLCTAALGVTSCGKPKLVQAPPGPADTGPALGLSPAPEGATVFDLKYVARTGAETDIPYHSYWGYGGSQEEAKKAPFIQEVLKQAPGVHHVYNPSLAGRTWSALEHRWRKPVALYFDVNADGKLTDNERLLPSYKEGDAFEFITPDFENKPHNGEPTLCRASLRVNFYSGNTEPNCMWSPAALLEANAVLQGRSSRLLLFANGPGGRFDTYGSSCYALVSGDQPLIGARTYFPRETLSRIIASEGEFYQLTLDGHRSNGLPARAVLAKDTSPKGKLALKLSGSNAVPIKLSYLYLNGVDRKEVYLHVTAKPGESVSLPAGTYALNSGQAGYGGDNADSWDVSFSEGPKGTIKDGAITEVMLGEPTLSVRAVDERDRYNRDAKSGTQFKRGTQIYLEPRIVGKDGEVYGRFREAASGSRTDKADRQPRITISAPDGKELLAKNMEYG